MNSKIKELFNSAKVIDTHAHVVLSETEGAPAVWSFRKESLVNPTNSVPRLVRLMTDHISKGVRPKAGSDSFCPTI